MMISQVAYRNLRKEVKEFIHSETLFAKVLSGTPLIRGFKADVSFSPLHIIIRSVSLCEPEVNAFSVKELKRLKEYLVTNPLGAISMISVDFSYDFKVFKNMYQTYDDSMSFDLIFPISDDIGEFVAIKVTDVTGNEVLQTFKYS